MINKYFVITIHYRIFVRIKHRNINRMKVTAIIEDSLINEAIKYSHAKTITEAVRIAIIEYIATKKLKELSEELNDNPLKFKHTADEIRTLNRQ